MLFATIPHPAYVFDVESLEFLEVNDAAVQQYGYSRDELLRMKTTDIAPEDDTERFQQRVSNNSRGQRRRGTMETSEPGRTRH